MATSRAIATWEFGTRAVGCSGDVLSGGGTCLDAVEAGIRCVELDPTVDSVGYGGLTNMEGTVQFDAAIMDGPRHRAGSVAALEGFRVPISIAHRVM